VPGTEYIREAIFNPKPAGEIFQRCDYFFASNGHRVDSQSLRTKVSLVSEEILQKGLTAWCITGALQNTRNKKARQGGKLQIELPDVSTAGLSVPHPED
jgi:hypothetical protein